MCRYNTRLFKDDESMQCVQGVYRLRRSNIQVQTTPNPRLIQAHHVFCLQASVSGLPCLRSINILFYFI